jgi:lysophospholipase L1-like esterase
MKSSFFKFAARGVIALLVIGLAASLAANYVIYQRGMQSYVELQQVRLDPNDAFLEQANKDLPPPAPGQKRLILFGDSRIAMWQPLPNCPGYQIVNRGVGSETTGQLLQRIDRDVIALHPDAVLIEMGINDLKNLGLFPQRQQQIINSCNRNTDLILERLRSRNIPVILLTIFPVGQVPLARRSIWSNKTIDAVNAWNQRMKQSSSRELIVVDCDPTFVSNGRMKDGFAPDMLHLNESGYGALNQVVEPVIHQLLSGGQAR